MLQTPAISGTRRPVLGWFAVGAIGLIYAVLFGLNYLLPLEIGNYETRIWNWSQWGLTIGAGIALLLKRHLLTIRIVVLGLILGAISGWSHMLHDPSFDGALLEGFGVWICLMGGAVLFADLEVLCIPAFQPPIGAIIRGIGIGIVAALPLTVINNLYFYSTQGSIEFADPFLSALTALSPGIHEEVIFRFFVLALCLTLLRDVATQRWATLLAVFMAVVPHSLNHLPSLFLANPVMAVILLIATSLLFGLPMALLQVRRSLEAAIAFHWFIDFARFLFGF